MSSNSNAENISPNLLPTVPPPEPLPRAQYYDADFDFELIEDHWQQCLNNLAVVCETVADMTKHLSLADQEYVRARLGFSRATVSKMVAYSNDPIWELGFNMYNVQPLWRELLYKYELIRNPACDV